MRPQSPTEKKLKTGVIGATGYVGQQYLSLLQNHPWFEVAKIAASNASAGKTLAEAILGREKTLSPLPPSFLNLTLLSLDDLKKFADGLDVVFIAVNIKKSEALLLEEALARLDVPVVSNNSASRMLGDVPVIIPEINPEHAEIIETQRKRLGVGRGFVTAKSNCSIQSYVPALTPLRGFGLKQVSVCTYQAITGSGRRLADAPEIANNLIPFIGGEEEKSEVEPLKVWGEIKNGAIAPSGAPVISAQCCRVCVEDGHTAAVSVSFERPPQTGDILSAWENFETLPQKLGLPSAPKPFLLYMPENDRPQPVLDAFFQNGMGITIGRLRKDNVLDYKFVCLSHNGIRGAAGGAILTAELLVKQGYII